MLTAGAQPGPAPEPGPPRQLVSGLRALRENVFVVAVLGFLVVVVLFVFDLAFATQAMADYPWLILLHWSVVLVLFLAAFIRDGDKQNDGMEIGRTTGGFPE